jgi:hypothetical protein
VCIFMICLPPSKCVHVYICIDIYVYICTHTFWYALIQLIQLAITLHIHFCVGRVLNNLLLAVFEYTIHSFNYNHHVPHCNLTFFRFHMSDIIQHISFYMWFISPSIIYSRIIHVVTNKRIPFLRLTSISLYVYEYMHHIFFIPLMGI